MFARRNIGPNPWQISRRKAKCLLVFERVASIPGLFVCLTILLSSSFKYRTNTLLNVFSLKFNLASRSANNANSHPVQVNCASETSIAFPVHSREPSSFYRSRYLVNVFFPFFFFASCLKASPVFFFFLLPLLFFFINIHSLLAINVTTYVYMYV